MTKENKTPFWQFRNEGNGTELILYGAIDSGGGWDKDCVTPAKFAKELAACLPADTLTVRIFSSGGDVFAAQAIYERLRECGAKIKVKIDGLAASAATVIAMAGDEIEMDEGGTFMIHDPAAVLFGSYSGEEMRGMMERLTRVKESIVTAYERRTGLEREKISALMAAETWMDGTEAKRLGFVTRLTGETGEAFSDKLERILMAAGGVDLRQYAKTPEEVLLKFGTGALQKEKRKTEEEKPMEIRNREELAAAYPALVREIEDAALHTAQNQAAEAERQRIQAIEDMTLPGFEALANEAKYKTFLSAKDFAVKLVQAQKKAGAAYLENRNRDADSSGANQVEGMPAGLEKEDQAKHDDALLDKIVGKLK